MAHDTLVERLHHGALGHAGFDDEPECPVKVGRWLGPLEFQEEPRGPDLGRGQYLFERGNASAALHSQLGDFLSVS